MTGSSSSSAGAVENMSNPWRDDFPILHNIMNGKPLAYLDSASSAQKPQVVIDTYNRLYKTQYANIHRGLYNFSQAITAEYEAVRGKIKRLINAYSENEIVFTRNTTEAINLVAQSWGKNCVQAGDEIILSAMEHHANIVPWQLLENQLGVVLKIVPVLDDGSLDLEAYKTLLSDKTKMVTVVHASNSLGTINPVKEIIAVAKAYNPDITTLVDGSQSVVHTAVDVQNLGCDFFTMTGHKLYGPNGVGVLWGKEALLNDMPPYQGGGDMIDTVSFDKGTTFKPAPAKFEAGTPAIAEVIALGAAVDYVLGIGLENIERHENELFSYMMNNLQGIDGITFFGKTDNRVSVLSFTAQWAHVSDIAMILDQCGVAVRTGHHCCMPLMERFNIDGTVRVSLALYSNKDDIDAFLDGMKKAKRLLS